MSASCWRSTISVAGNCWIELPALVPGIHVFGDHRRKDVDGRDEPGHDAEKVCDSNLYSIAACSGASCCLRSATLVEPIMIASGIAHSVKIITIW